MLRNLLTTVDIVHGRQTMYAPITIIYNYGLGWTSPSDATILNWVSSSFPNFALLALTKCQTVC